MKAKKLFLPLLLVCIALFSITGCTGDSNYETPYDDLQITKIESLWNEGMPAFACSYKRTFDFESDTVYDTWITYFDEDEEIIEDLGIEYFNNPLPVSEFSGEQEEALYNKIKSLGFLTWKDRYETDDIICDGGSERVTVYFADGTTKSTYIYFEYPTNYKEIIAAFTDIIGEDFYAPAWWQVL